MVRAVGQGGGGGGGVNVKRQCYLGSSHAFTRMVSSEIILHLLVTLIPCRMEVTTPVVKCTLHSIDQQVGSSTICLI